MKNRMAWIFGGGAVVGLAMVAASLGACSSGGGGEDAGKDTSTGPDTGNKDTGGNPDTGTQDSGDAGTVCDSSIPTIHQTEAGTIYCGFTDAGSLDCPTGQECCLGGKTGNTFAPEQCANWGGVCNNPPPDAGTPIECADIADCTANGQSGKVCCLQGAGAPTMVAGCNYPKISGGSAIVCETPTGNACASGETQICESDSDCPTGKTCTAGKWKLFQLGFCM